MAVRRHKPITADRTHHFGALWPLSRDSSICIFIYQKRPPNCWLWLFRAKHANARRKVTSRSSYNPKRPQATIQSSQSSSQTGRRYTGSPRRSRCLTQRSTARGGLLWPRAVSVTTRLAGATVTSHLVISHSDLITSSAWTGHKIRPWFVLLLLTKKSPLQACWTMMLPCWG